MLLRAICFIKVYLSKFIICTYISAVDHAQRFSDIYIPLFVFLDKITNYIAKQCIEKSHKCYNLLM